MRRWLLTSVLLANIACSSGGGSNADLGEDADDVDEGAIDELSDIPRGRGESSVSVRYAKTAKGNWKRGEAEFDDENFLAAQKYYQYIRATFPYSAYAVQAELRNADCLFERGRFLEAIDAYQNFSRLHPTHKDVPYAAYRTGAAYYEQVPGDWFLIPPSHEKDQAAIRDAERALRTYVERYPKDGHIEEGKKLLNEARSRMARHERYVADFYDNADKPISRLKRLETLHDKFADVALDASLLLEMIEVYLEVEQVENAQKIQKELAEKFPNSPERNKAAELIQTAPKPKMKAKPTEDKPTKKAS